jgi:hypothetical protein
MFVLSDAVTVSLVLGPETVKPFPTVNVLENVEPDMVLKPNWTVTLVTPAGEAAVKESVLDGWNKFVPFG